MSRGIHPTDGMGIAVPDLGRVASWRGVGGVLLCHNFSMLSKYSMSLWNSWKNKDVFHIQCKSEVALYYFGQNTFQGSHY